MAANPTVKINITRDIHTKQITRDYLTSKLSSVKRLRVLPILPLVTVKQHKKKKTDSEKTIKNQRLR